MQALKAMVILMGVLIVGAIAVLSYGLMNDWHKKKTPIETDVPMVENQESSVQPATVISNSVFGEFEDWKVLLPTGAEMVEMTPEGNLLYLRYKLPSRAGGVIVLDLTQQKQVGHIQY